MRDRRSRPEWLYGCPAYLVACSRRSGGGLQPSSGQYARRRPGPAAGEENLQCRGRGGPRPLHRGGGRPRPRRAALHDGTFARRDGRAQHGAGFPRGNGAACRTCHHRNAARHDGHVKAVQQAPQPRLRTAYAAGAETDCRHRSGGQQRSPRGCVFGAKREGIRRPGDRAHGRAPQRLGLLPRLERS